jgi:hypothetical protein
MTKTPSGPVPKVRSACNNSKKPVLEGLGKTRNAKKSAETTKQAEPPANDPTQVPLPDGDDEDLHKANLKNLSLPLIRKRPQMKLLMMRRRSSPTLVNRLRNRLLPGKRMRTSTPMPTSMILTK